MSAIRRLSRKWDLAQDRTHDKAEGKDMFLGATEAAADVVPSPAASSSAIHFNAISSLFPRSGESKGRRQCMTEVGQTFTSRDETADGHGLVIMWRPDD